MTIDERRKYLRKMQERYLLADRRVYGPEVDAAVRVIAESTDYICAERLTPNLPWLAKHLAAHGELAISAQLLEQLDRISVSSVERRLAHIRQDEPRLPRQGPKQRNRLLRDVPMTRIPWQEQEPGHFEVDLVHHCGPTASGDYLHTIQMVDVATAWSERVAVLGRSYLAMKDGFSRILARLPFPVLEIHPDNGSEFFNNHLLRFWHELTPKPQLSRSRPYNKNDNRFVEQKNSTLVRSSLKIGRDDRPHVSYQTGSYPYYGYLIYKYHDGTAWQSKVVDNLGYDASWDTSLALDWAGQPHISYQYPSGRWDLRCAYKNGTIWQVETVDAAGDVGYHSSLVLQIDGHEHISYYDSDRNELKYAYRESTTPLQRVYLPVVLRGY